jgi:hypothetical protein
MTTLGFGVLSGEPPSLRFGKTRLPRLTRTALRSDGDRRAGAAWARWDRQDAAGGRICVAARERAFGAAVLARRYAGRARHELGGARRAGHSRCRAEGLARGRGENRRARSHAGVRRVGGGRPFACGSRPSGGPIGPAIGRPEGRSSLDGLWTPSTDQAGRTDAWRSPSDEQSPRRHFLSKKRNSCDLISAAFHKERRAGELAGRKRRRNLERGENSLAGLARP